MTLFDRATDASFHTDSEDDFFVENHITSIEEIKMKLVIYPCCDKGVYAIGEDFVNKTFVLNP